MYLRRMIQHGLYISILCLSEKDVGRFKKRVESAIFTPANLPYLARKMCQEFIFLAFIYDTGEVAHFHMTQKFIPAIDCL